MAKGRIAVYVPDHPKANNRGYILRSRYRMEQHLGRLLDSHEHVHHRDENPLNDDLSNLQVKSARDHAIDHGNLKPAPWVIDWERIRELMDQGLGYRRIAQLTGYKLYAVRYACREIRMGA